MNVFIDHDLHHPAVMRFAQGFVLLPEDTETRRVKFLP